MTQSLPFTALSPLGSDLTSMLLTMKGKNEEEVVVKTLAPTAPRDMPPSKKGMRIKSLIQTVFGTPSFEEGNKSPSLRLDVEGIAGTPLPKMKKAPKPKKAVKEPPKAKELERVKAISPSERESREEIDFDIRHIAGGELNVKVVANMKDHTEAPGYP